VKETTAVLKRISDFEKLLEAKNEVFSPLRSFSLEFFRLIEFLTPFTQYLPKYAILDSIKHQDEEEQTKNPEAEVLTPDPPKKQNLEVETKTPEPPKKQNPVDTPGKSTKKIGEPITSVTPLQST
jgi:hypothetical protein